MGKILKFAFIVMLACPNTFSQTKVFSLENNTGVTLDVDGSSVTGWINQDAPRSYGDAIQTNTILSGDLVLEDYPGKTNIGFSKDGSFLELIGTKNALNDNSYSVFYVGKANPIGIPALLVGNYNIDGALTKSSGIRFVKLSDGTISFDHARPNYLRTNLSTIPGDGYFFFGFTVDAIGNYKYFDNSSPSIKKGRITSTMITNTDGNLKFNLFQDRNGTLTANHTEVVEFSMYDGVLGDTAFEEEYTRLSTEYAELVITEFEVTNVLPNDDGFREGISVDAPIVITFDKAIDETSDYPKIYINKSDTEATGNWVLSPANVLTFTPTEDWPARSLITLEIQEGLKSIVGDIIGLANRDTYGFIVNAEETFAFESYQLDDPIAVISYMGRTGKNIVDHELPIKITTPVIDVNTTEKFPVHIFVHGGGWLGGTEQASSADYSLHKDYLAKSLGIVTLSISYRCVDSDGTYSLAEEDVDRAYQWAVDNADTYNLDMTKVFFSGGSAGTPLAALASQRLPNILGFIGFNGIYDFVNDAGDYGVGNWYKQDIPSEEGNSAIFQLSDNPPPTLLMHGDTDNTISHLQSTRFADAINLKGGRADAIIYPGEVHSFFSRGKEAHEDALYEMANFISNRLQENSLSIAAINEESKIIAYPNPVREGSILHFQLSSKINNDKVDVQIVNQLGQIVLNTALYPNWDAKTLNIDTKGLSEGYYIIKMEMNSISSTSKFIIN